MHFPTPHGSKRDGETYGCSSGCPGCVWLQTNLGQRQTHTPNCRRRFADLLVKDAADRNMVDPAQAIHDTWLSTEFEKGHADGEGDKEPCEVKTDEQDNNTGAGGSPKKKAECAGSGERV